MPDRPIDVNLAQTTNPEVANNTPSQEEFRQRLARVLDRGWAVDRLDVTGLIPDDLHAEWIPIDAQSQARAELLGFKKDDKYAIARNLNDAGDGTTRVGDVVLMVQPKWMHQMIEEKRRDDYKRNHMQTKQKEEREYEANNQKIDMPATIASRAETVSGTEIKDTISPNK